MSTMQSTEHTMIGDLLASAKGLGSLFDDIKSLQAFLGRARTTVCTTIDFFTRMRQTTQQRLNFRSFGCQPRKTV